MKSYVLPLVFLCHLLAGVQCAAAGGADPDSGGVTKVFGAPVIVDNDTFFSITTRLGPFTAEQRATAANEKLAAIVQSNKELNDSVRVVETTASSNLVFGTTVLMGISDDDATPIGKTRPELARDYASRLTSAMRTYHQRYSASSLIRNTLIAAGLLALAFVVFWLTRILFLRAYEGLEHWEGTVVPSITFRSHEILSAETITSFLILIAKGIRLALSLVIVYFFLSYVFSLFPWTRAWNVRPILGGIFSIVLVTIVAAALLRGANAFFRSMKSNRIPSWKGTLIKPVRIKKMEVLSVDRIAGMTEFAAKFFHVAVLLAIGYIYSTIVFSFFEFTSTWAATLLGYVTDPLWTAVKAFVKFLPNLFSILIIIFLTRYVLKLVRLVFTEVGRGTITLSGFFTEWAEPTYKIVRFLILAFAAIVVFPYLPGSDSPFFQGITVFLGILFSLGSSSAIANMVAGVVLTYMRPFRIGDRVKIADTTGDVVEKTLLVTRVRTIKNVDITIPNAMVLGSHIVNFSSSAKEKGLILHTTVTIGYDAPWKQVHALLIAAADTTANILKEPKPFILQTSLDDFYVSYELNAYTDNPSVMARIYSELHQNIQDKFNEGGVEIMSPHYSAMRDGNQITIPIDYLPKTYQAPAFRLFPFGGFSDKPTKSE